MPAESVDRRWILAPQHVHNATAVPKDQHLAVIEPQDWQLGLSGGGRGRGGARHVLLVFSPPPAWFPLLATKTGHPPPKTRNSFSPMGFGGTDAKNTYISL